MFFEIESNSCALKFRPNKFKTITKKKVRTNDRYGLINLKIKKLLMFFFISI